jgi:hypothetical protein
MLVIVVPHHDKRKLRHRTHVLRNFDKNLSTQSAILNLKNLPGIKGWLHRLQAQDTNLKAPPALPLCGLMEEACCRRSITWVYE